MRIFFGTFLMAWPVWVALLGEFCDEKKNDYGQIVIIGATLFAAIMSAGAMMIWE